MRKACTDIDVGQRQLFTQLLTLMEERPDRRANIPAMAADGQRDFIDRSTIDDVMGDRFHPADRHSVMLLILRCGTVWMAFGQ
ncbi:hypothetical protein ASE37_01185 [Rhizobium sp. Root268]|nr:hypothetical protein ASC86_01185 [Rhizobium sp. Root1212]KRD37644.1 hypothetical protein ASE37_01185 [Rhizobium sp. Root268]